MTIFRKFIAAMTPRPAFLDQNKKLHAQFVRHALRSQTEIPPDAVKDMVDHDARFARAAAAIAVRKTITVESNVTVDLDR